MSRVSENDRLLDSLTLGPESDSAILFIHGLGADREFFTADQQWFADRRRTIAVSLRGHGPDPLPLPDEGILTLAVEDCLRVLDAEGVDTVHLVGNSMGGLVAFEILRARPERVRSLTTFGTTPVLSTSEMTLRSAIWTTKLLWPRGLAWMSRRFGSFDKRAGEALARSVVYLKPDDYARYTRIIARYDYLDLLRESPVPYLLLRGHRDTQINKNLASTLALAEQQPNMRVIEVPEGGHLMNLEAPDSFRRHLEAFIDEIDAAR